MATCTQPITFCMADHWRNSKDCIGKFQHNEVALYLTVGEENQRNYWNGLYLKDMKFSAQVNI